MEYILSVIFSIYNLFPSGGHFELLLIPLTELAYFCSVDRLCVKRSLPHLRDEAVCSIRSIDFSLFFCVLF